MFTNMTKHGRIVWQIILLYICLIELLRGILIKHRDKSSEIFFCFFVFFLSGTLYFLESKTAQGGDPPGASRAMTSKGQCAQVQTEEQIYTKENYGRHTFTFRKHSLQRFEICFAVG